MSGDSGSVVGSVNAARLTNAYLGSIRGINSLVSVLCVDIPMGHTRRRLNYNHGQTYLFQPQRRGWVDDTGLVLPLKTDCGSAVRESVVSKGFSTPCFRRTSRNSAGVG